MSKKQDEYFFKSFIECAEYACQAAHLLESVMDNFDPDELPRHIDEMHSLEHAADTRKHEMLDVLAKAFITPIEREDIIDLSHCIDNMTDKIEDVFLRLYTNNIREMQPDAVELAKVVIRCCESVKEMLEEFPNFKRSKTLKDHIIRINTMEEEGRPPLHLLHGQAPPLRRRRHRDYSLARDIQVPRRLRRLLRKRSRRSRRRSNGQHLSGVSPLTMRVFALGN